VEKWKKLAKKQREENKKNEIGLIWGV
jgi:hypothetical protein